MTVGQLLTKAYLKLKTAKINNYQLDAEYLLSWVTKKSRAHLLAYGEQKTTKHQQIKYQKLINLRTKHWPLAYLTGHQEFFGLNFQVDNRVLIPRPETEQIVEKIIKEKTTTPTAIIDVGCGSGAIIISLAKNIKTNKISYYGLDISAPALTVAKKNAKFHQVDKIIKFIKSDLLSSLSDQTLNQYQQLIIAANLPYLTNEQIKAEPSIKHEPRLAQLSGPDGLDHYRRLFDQVAQLNRKNITLLIEINPDQKTAIIEMVKKHWPLLRPIISQDLNSCDRIVMIKL